MKFLNKDVFAGDIVRVLIKDGYYHYGIYIGSDLVIEYGSKHDFFKLDSKDIIVKKVSVKEFLDGGHLEVASLSLIEKLKRNNVKKTIELAEARLGEAKYNIIDNNCEHFCYEVVFNKHYSSQEKRLKEFKK